MAQHRRRRAVSGRRDYDRARRGAGGIATVVYRLRRPERPRRARWSRFGRMDRGARPCALRGRNTRDRVCPGSGKP